MSARGSRETRTHYFDATSLAELGEDVEGITADLGEWSLDSIDLDADVVMLRNHQGGAMRASVRYSAIVTLSRRPT